MTPILQRLKSKTYWAAILGALLLVIEQNSGVFSLYLPEQFRSAAVMLWPVVMIALRETTTTALSGK